KSRQLTKDDIALMVRELVLVTLPHKDPGDVPEWVRRNCKGDIAVTPYQFGDVTGVFVGQSYKYEFTHHQGYIVFGKLTAFGSFDVGHVALPFPGRLCMWGMLAVCLGEAWSSLSGGADKGFGPTRRSVPMSCR